MYGTKAEEWDYCDEDEATKVRRSVEDLKLTEINSV